MTTLNLETVKIVKKELHVPTLDEVKNGNDLYLYCNHFFTKAFFYENLTEILLTHHLKNCSVYECIER
jgi:hypothetical protein